jgi:molybdopterin-guanine dinucleotide biosynthesis protein
MNIHININGPKESGKTTLANIIGRALEDHGIACEIDDSDYSYCVGSRIDWLKGKKDLIVKISTSNV